MERKHCLVGLGGGSNDRDREGKARLNGFCTRKDAVGKFVLDLARHADHLHEPQERFERLARKFRNLNEVRVKAPSLLRKANKVRTEIYKIKSFLRLEPAGKDFLVGIFDSRHLVVDRVTRHFKTRFPGFNLVILNKTRRSGCVAFASRDLQERWHDTRPGRRLAWRNADFRVQDVPLATLIRMPPGVDAKSLALGLARSVSRLATGNGDGGGDGLGTRERIGRRVGDRGGTASRYEHGKISPSTGDLKEEWNAYYDSQVIEGRVNHDRAARMYGKEYLARLGTPVEKARILGKTGDKRQRTLLDDL